jgi:3-oxoacyl-[acyl-carrier protein] reductase
MSLVKKVALVTGAANGIGRAVALHLAAEGASVVVAYGGSADQAAKVVAEIGHGRAKAIQADASKPAEAKRLVAETVKEFGKIDILVPAAGVMPMTGLELLTEVDFDKAFAVNVKTPMFLCQVSSISATPRSPHSKLIGPFPKQHASQHMTAGSRIVLFSTTLCSASTVMPHYLLYVSTKGAVEQATRVLSKDLGKKGINVNCVAPGPIKTDGFMANQTEQSLNMASSMNPNGRIGEPEEVADTVVFLCQNASRWVTGQTLRVNGGMA